MYSFCLPFSKVSKARPRAAVVHGGQLAMLPPDPFRASLTALSSMQGLHLHLPDHVPANTSQPDIADSCLKHGPPPAISPRSLFPSFPAPASVQTCIYPYRTASSAQTTSALQDCLNTKAVRQWICILSHLSATCTFISMLSTSSKSLVKIIFH